MSKRPKIFQPVVAIANDLATGAVVFRDTDGRWSNDIARAEIATSPESADALLARAQADQGPGNLVVDVAVIEVVREGAFVRPLLLRELIRTSGPTIALPRDSSPCGALPAPGL
jgi:hypothetical protein